MAPAGLTAVHLYLWTVEEEEEEEEEDKKDKEKDKEEDEEMDKEKDEEKDEEEEEEDAYMYIASSQSIYLGAGGISVRKTDRSLLE